MSSSIKKLAVGYLFLFVCLCKMSKLYTSRTAFLLLHCSITSAAVNEYVTRNLAQKDAQMLVCLRAS